ncbi:MAG TPA: hypothetical protein VL371_25850 [Gemmataceae bacterium]|jgi:hypothetical protein|nr:hypothetical protein [Gemmataceae bacterium]
MPRRFHDDDYDDRPQTEESTSAKAILLVVLGVLAIIGLGGTAAVGLYFMRFEAVSQERALAAQAQAQANAAAAQFAAVVPDVAEAPDPYPMPNPPASEEYPPDLGPERQPERQGNWTILFRSDDPGYWDTPGNAANYAIPLFRAPAGIRYVRLKRMDTGEALIIPVTAGRLRSTPTLGSGLPPGAPPAVAAPTSPWVGTNAVESGARHLGVIDLAFVGPWPGVAIETGDSGGTGSGFGHKRNAEGAGQRYAWKGQEIAKTVFEIAVTAAQLADDEKGLLVNPAPNP